MSERTERVVLGMIMNEPQHLTTAVGLGIRPEHFVCEARKKIFDEIAKQELQSNPFDGPALMIVLGDSVSPEIVACLSEAPMTLRFDYWAEELRKNTWRRNTGLTLSSLAKKTYSQKEFEPIEPLMQELNQTVEQILCDYALQQSIDCSQIIDPYSNDIEQRIANFKQGTPSRISTGLTNLDKKIIGFCPSKFYVLAARTSVGKTTMAVNFMASALKQDKSVLFFSVEMTELEIFEKMLSLEAHISDFELTRGNVEKDLDKIFETLCTVRKYSGFINSSFGNSIQAIETEAKLLNQRRPLDFIIVDYVQEIVVENSKSQSKALELGEIARRLKSLSMRMKIPVLCLCQINRESEKREDRIPRLTDLKDSDSLGLAADCVMLLWKDENDYWMNVVKARKGSKTGAFKIAADLEFNRFSNHRDMGFYNVG